MEKKVAIIGAGVSGLLACKYALSKGFRPIVFEAESSIGGVWTATFQTTKLQTPKHFYQFSDFPWPESVTKLYPDGQQVLDYIESYARHFDLLRHVKFQSKVLRVAFEGQPEKEMAAWALWGGSGDPFASKGKWSITVHHTGNLSTEVYQVDFLILCVGRFSGIPNIPDFPSGKGLEAFDGTVIHSMDYAAMDDAAARNLVKGKRVAVVGLQKSALDIAVECSSANEADDRRLPCTVIYRTEHWNVPDYQPWGVPIAYLYLNRFSELSVHKPGEGLLFSVLATLLTPVRWGLAKFIETHIRRKLRLSKFGMVPKHGFLQQLSSCTTSTVPEDFYDRVEKGSIRLKKAQNFSFCKQGILVDGEDEALEMDVVILATGFRGLEKLRRIFVSPTFQDRIAGSPDIALTLYRECIHPRIPQLGIIGFSESISNLHTSEMRCRWLAELLDGKFELPSIVEMERDVAEWDNYKKEYSGRYFSRSCIAGLNIWYNDQLCKDMGWNPRRKKGFFADLFQPYGPMDYAHPHF